MTRIASTSSGAARALTVFVLAFFAASAEANNAPPAALRRAVARTLSSEGLDSSRVIEPWVQQDKLVAGDGADGDRFGVAVAVEGDTALVGALLANVDGNAAQGAVYVFVRSGDAWIVDTKLTADDGQAFDRFGASVAMDGDTALVGAWGAAGSRGAAWVFTRAGGVWAQQGRLAADDGAVMDFFGESVALDGDTALIGAWGCDIGGHNEQGAAYVFTRSDGVWTEVHKFVADDGEANDSFGQSVALSGDAALIPSRFAKVGDNFLQGAVYASTRADGDWSALTKLAAADGAPLDRFGFSIAADGNSAVIGALGGNEDRGAAYVFTRSEQGWIEQAKLGASDGVEFDDFGQRVGIDGNRVIVGADFAAVDGRALQGAAYVFTRSGDTWSEESKLVAEDGAENDSFGIAVAIDGGNALVGSWLADVDGIADHGAAYLFELPMPDAIFADGFDPLN